jgi:hypothetical protein
VTPASSASAVLASARYLNVILIVSAILREKAVA